MKSKVLVSAAWLMLCGGLAAQAESPAVCFEPNRGQFADGGSFAVEQKRWRASFGEGGVQLEARRLVADPGPAIAAPVAGKNGPTGLSFQMRFVGGSAVPQGSKQHGGQSNYFPTHDRETWTLKIPHFSGLRYENVWPGIDLEFEGREGGLVARIVADPQADLSVIGIVYQGVVSQGIGPLQQDASGAVRIDAGWGVFRQMTPERRGGGPVAGSYRIDGQGAVRFLSESAGRLQ